MSPAYRQELEQLDRAIGKPMHPETRAVVTIPAFGEGKIIYNCLGQFLHQTDQNGVRVDPRSFEIIVFENDTEARPKDQTEAEIARFKRDHPEMNIQYAFKRWSAEDIQNGVNTIGNGRRYNCDLALFRAGKRSSRRGELIVINNDADLEGISPQFIATAVGDFDANPNLDTVVGKRNLGPEALRKPNIRAGQRLWETFDTVMRHTGGGGRVDPNQRVAGFSGMIGENSAMRASIYAAVGGYNGRAKLAEDRELAFMMRAARGDDSRFVYDNRLETIKDPRRYLACMVSGKPFIQMYDSYHEDKDIRDLDNMELYQRIPDTFDLPRFELDATAIYQQKAKFGYLGDGQFDQRFKKVMDLMGVEYVLEKRTNRAGQTNTYVKVTSSDRLERKLANRPPQKPLNPDQAAVALSPEVRAALGKLDLKLLAQTIISRISRNPEATRRMVQMIHEAQQQADRERRVTPSSIAARIRSHLPGRQNTRVQVK